MACTYSTPFRTDHEVWASVTLSPTPPVSNPNAQQLPHQPAQTFQWFLQNYPAPTSLTNGLPGNDNAQHEIYRSHDMALLHHWTTATCQTLTRSDCFDKLWRIDIPKLAFSSPYLLHSLLAVAANHLIYQPQPDSAVSIEQCHSLVKHHYAMAITLFRPQLENITPQNSSAIFAFSMVFTFLSASMAPPPDESFATREDRCKSHTQHTVDLLRLIRGCSDVRSSCLPHIQKSTIFSDLPRITATGGSEPFTFDGEVAIRLIEHKIQEIEPEFRTFYSAAIAKLRDCNPRREEKIEQQGLVLSWAAGVEGILFEDMENGKPVALALLAFYGTLLWTVRGVWWIGEMGRRRKFWDVGSKSGKNC